MSKLKPENMITKTLGQNKMKVEDTAKTIKGPKLKMFQTNNMVFQN